MDPQPVLTLDGRRLAATTCITSPGAYVVALQTALGTHGIELQSTYVGCEDTDTHVTHLLLARDAHAIETRAVPHADIPVMYTRRRCLYDHLVRLQDFAGELGLGRLQADLLEETLLALERG